MGIVLRFSTARLTADKAGRRARRSILKLMLAFSTIRLVSRCGRCPSAGVLSFGDRKCFPTLRGRGDVPSIPGVETRNSFANYFELYCDQFFSEGFFMFELRYDKRLEPNGDWTVFDVVTGRPAELNGQFCCGLRRGDAYLVAHYLNLQRTGANDNQQKRGA
ncbi:hypothetical protein [Brucella intermedia]|uniref:hypothetical protein n=1 Tax=Brucella intermedia TaxID=94625 RepID=UPI00236062F0|nr:hypothetical protein [Brucella intermedia]